MTGLIFREAVREDRPTGIEADNDNAIRHHAKERLPDRGAPTETYLRLDHAPSENYQLDRRQETRSIISRSPTASDIVAA